MESYKYTAGTSFHIVMIIWNALLTYTGEGSPSDSSSGDLRTEELGMLEDCWCRPTALWRCEELVAVAVVTVVLVQIAAEMQFLAEIAFEELDSRVGWLPDDFRGDLLWEWCMDWPCDTEALSDNFRGDLLGE